MIGVTHGDVIHGTAESCLVAAARKIAGRPRGLGRAMLLHGMHLARAAGADHATVACLGAPGHPAARGLYYSVGFRKFSWDVPLLKPGG